ncbi:MAG: MBL fold metallo-hydrolase [Alphaproteobacteria bacterium]
MSLELVILGCGSSAGVPRVAGDWGDCDPDEPKNRRSRAGLLVRAAGLTIVIDTPPELRLQLNDANVQRVDRVFFTHAHADQTHGIDELRGFYLHQREKIHCHADPVTLKTLRDRFDYCFTEIAGYPPILVGHEMTGPVTLEGPSGDTVRIVPLKVVHGAINAYGYRIECKGKAAAYLPDVSDIPEPEWVKMAGLDCLIQDALRYKSHPSHTNVDTALAWIERCRPGRAVLTNMHIDLDYRTLAAALPEGVEPAYDGMVITV